MSERSFERWEAQVQAAARALPYPPTPDIAGAVRRRLASEPARRAPRRWRLAWAATIALVILAALLAVPEVRAGVLEVLRVGAIRIFLTEPTPTPVRATSTPPVERPAGGPTRVATATAPIPATRGPSPTTLHSVLDLAGETTLAEAQARAPFPILLPAYPPDLGPPDRVFYQDLGGPAVLLVWLVPGSETEVHLSLYGLSSDVFGSKLQPQVIEVTTVNGQRALWVRGPHLLQFRDTQGRTSFEPARLVEGNVLIWTEGDITYRLEGDLPLDEAVRIAESLR